MSAKARMSGSAVRHKVADLYLQTSVLKIAPPGADISGLRFNSSPGPIELNKLIFPELGCSKLNIPGKDFISIPLPLPSSSIFSMIDSKSSALFFEIPYIGIPDTAFEREIPLGSSL